MEEVARWHHWLAQQQTLAAEQPPRKEGMETITQMITQDTEPDPGGGPGGRRRQQHVAPDRRITIEENDMRHGRTSSAKTCNGFQDHCVVDLDSHVIREVVVRPAHEPEPAVVGLLVEAWEKAPGLLHRDVDLGSMASPRIGPWAEQGVSSSARPWACGGALCTKHDFPCNCVHGPGMWPGGQSVPLSPGRTAQLPARACDACPQRAQCTTAKPGQGRPLTIREDEPCQHQLRAKLRPKRGRAARRSRTAVEQAMAHQVAHPGRRARYKGLRKNQFAGRRHAAGSHLQVAAHYAEAHQLAS